MAYLLFYLYANYPQKGNRKIYASIHNDEIC